MSPLVTVQPRAGACPIAEVEPTLRQTNSAAAPLHIVRAMTSGVML
jgi:hypothetical protein